MATDDLACVHAAHDLQRTAIFTINIIIVSKKEILLHMNNTGNL